MMGAKFESLGLLAILLVFFGALSTCGAVTGSASAAACIKVKTGEPSTFESRLVTGTCEGTLAASGFAKVLEVTGEPVVGEIGVFCFKVANVSEPSNWKNSKCTEENKGGKGEYIKATAACSTLIAIAGAGSSLQKLAEWYLWGPESNCNVRYTPVDDFGVRHLFGEEEAGSLEKPYNSGYTYIGTDEPLDEAQLKNGDEAANGEYSTENKNGKGQTIVIPVAQAAIAVIVNPPEKCKLKAITDQNLWEVWSGVITEWSQINGKIKVGEGGVTEEGGCKKKITRYVRADLSGTTSVFKTYLSEIEELKGLTKACGKKWSELDNLENNIVWPESGSEGCTGLSPLFKASTEGDSVEVQEVLSEDQGSKEGSIGYANLWIARDKLGAEPRYTWVKVENENGKRGFYPGTANVNGGKEPTTERGQSNCEGTSYGVQPKVTIDDNWAAVNGANPGGGPNKNTNYSICTLTYDVALANYEKAGYTSGKELEAATQQYLKYVVGEGQAQLPENDYLKVEEAVGKKAEELVEKI